ncbi:DUF6093 family protein [Aeromicrobium sp. 9AM]|uniref:DUF6093 family protein n=1 Tax=Aeromicrobium sp. 9AM TaxID=2653126 RepID=UPI0012EFDC5F|nr:DUF6093 family protein [Aeromicrobium sp. 9AM]VXC08580.1 putative Phage associated protein [Aeromicrobium sp. 9AM]
MTADFAAQVAIGLSEGRALAESLMTASITVRYKTSRMTQDPVTGKEVPVMAVRFTSPAKFQTTGSLATSDVDSGGRRVAVDQLQIHYPVSKPQVEQDDEITCDTNPNDPRLEGRVFLVGDPMNKTYATATRLNVREKP